jgi:hypothetical protein
MMAKFLFSLCTLTALAAAASPAEAQMSSQPFSFGSVVNGPIAGGSGGAGMSSAGRQAIINEKLFGARPRAILVGPSGDILTVDRGPGNIAVVRETQNAVIPQYRGSRLGLFGLASTLSGRSYGIGFGNASIDLWVSMVGDAATAMPSASRTSQVIDAWAASVDDY